MNRITQKKICAKFSTIRYQKNLNVIWCADGICIAFAYSTREIISSWESSKFTFFLRTLTGWWNQKNKWFTTLCSFCQKEMTKGVFYSRGKSVWTRICSMNQNLSIAAFQSISWIFLWVKRIGMCWVMKRYIDFDWKSDFWGRFWTYQMTIGC